MFRYISKKISNGNKIIWIQGKRIKLPTPQLHGTERQRQTYANLKADEIIRKKKLK